MNKIVFVGTNFFAASILEKLHKKKINIEIVFTKKDNKKGRGMKLTASEVKKTANKIGLKCITTNNINSTECINFFKKFNPNIIIVIEYGDKISDDLIKTSKNGIINTHPSILPKFRGATPIQNTILYGEKESGVSVIKINNKIDSGNILNLIKFNLKKKETYKTLSIKLIKVATKCLIKTLKDIKNNNIIEINQNEENASYTKKLEKDFFKINFNKKSEYIDGQIRALTGIKYPHIMYKKNVIKIIKIKIINKNNNQQPGKIINITKDGIDVKTINGIIRIKEIQFQGEKIKKIKDIINSNKFLFKKNELIN